MIKDGASDRKVNGERACDSNSLSALMSKHGIDTALIGVPKLARILGIASSTIYAYMRSGRFFMPYRLVNGTPMIRVDDFVSWYVSSLDEIQPGSPRPANLVEPPVLPSEASAMPPNVVERPSKRGRKRIESRPASLNIEYSVGDLLSQEDADRAIDGLVSSVLARLPKRDAAAGS